jgi:hypothetical protein
MNKMSIQVSTKIAKVSDIFPLGVEVLLLSSEEVLPALRINERNMDVPTGSRQATMRFRHETGDYPMN